jgi:TM2 domain-containing membrane protein YozV
MIMKTKQLFLLAFALLLSYAISYSQTVNPELKKALDRVEIAKKIALETNSIEDWQEVINELKKAESIDKQYGFTLYNLGYAYENINDYDNSIAYYKKFLLVEPESEIAEDLSTKVNQLEYLKDRTKKQTAASENMLGLWKSVETNQYTGTPLWIFRIDKFNEDIRISVLPKSFKYNSNFTYPTAISLLYQNRLNFLFTTDVNLNPQEEMNKLSNVLHAGETVKSVIDPFIPSYFGAAATLVGAIPTKKDRNEQSAYVFNIDVSDSTKLTGKCNVKEYLTVAGQSPKTVLDEIEDYTFVKTNHIEYDAIKVKYNKRKGAGLALALSFIPIPGIGQFYNDQYLKGGLVAGSTVLFSILAIATLETKTHYYREIQNGQWVNTGVSHYTKKLSNFGALCISLAFYVKLYSIIEAPISAKKINKKFNLAYNGVYYESNNFCLNISPTLTPFASANKTSAAPGIGLSLNFK